MLYIYTGRGANTADAGPKPGKKKVGTEMSNICTSVKLQQTNKQSFGST
jgi:hypothetical protein